MGEILTTPDVEAVAVFYLRTALGALADKVATKVPSTMPSKMVRVSLTGGSRSNLITDRVQLTIQCWADDEPTASNLARRAHAHMIAAAGAITNGLWIRAVSEVGGVQFFPDPDTTKPRYQFTVRLSVRPT
ncbi:MAG: hypothetical protein M3536_00420 [Actinomycetota bacterium]|nr:hypothetical protein [Actinomycetota bacterium]